MKPRPAWRGELRFALLCAGVVASSACPQQTAVWIEPGSTAERLVFGVSRVRGGSEPIQITLLRIDRFETESGEYVLHWGYAAAGGIVAEGATRIVYGVDVPADAEPLMGASLEAPELVEGCYLAYDTGTGRSVFVVDAAGRVLELAWPDCRDALPRVRKP